MGEVKGTEIRSGWQLNARGENEYYFVKLVRGEVVTSFTTPEESRWKHALYILGNSALGLGIAALTESWLTSKAMGIEGLAPLEKIPPTALMTGALIGIAAGILWTHKRDAPTKDSIGRELVTRY